VALQRDAIVYPLRPLGDARTPRRNTHDGSGPASVARRFSPAVTSATPAHRSPADGRAADRRPVSKERPAAPADRAALSGHGPTQRPSRTETGSVGADGPKGEEPDGPSRRAPGRLP
jgi:hypothetical protein